MPAIRKMVSQKSVLSWLSERNQTWPMMNYHLQRNSKTRKKPSRVSTVLKTPMMTTPKSPSARAPTIPVLPPCLMLARAAARRRHRHPVARTVHRRRPHLHLDPARRPWTNASVDSGNDHVSRWRRVRSTRTVVVTNLRRRPGIRQSAAVRGLLHVDSKNDAAVAAAVADSGEPGARQGWLRILSIRSRKTNRIHRPLQQTTAPG